MSDILLHSTKLHFYHKKNNSSLFNVIHETHVAPSIAIICAESNLNCFNIKPHSILSGRCRCPVIATNATISGRLCGQVGMYYYAELHTSDTASG